MINFEKLITSVLVREQSADDEDQLANSASSFLLGKYSNLAQNYTDKYTQAYNFAFPVEDQYKSLIYTAANSAVRSVKDSDRYPDIKAVFPILDLVGLTTQEFRRGQASQQSNKDAERQYEDFIRRMKASPGAPLEFDALSPWAKMVKTDYFGDKQKIDIGKLRLEAPEFQQQSLYAVIQKLFQLRLLTKQNILNLNDPSIPPKSQKFIDQFLFDPNSYLSGQKPIPEKQIKALYDDTTAKLILEVSKNTYEFFAQQADINIGGTQSLGPKQAEAYKQFLNNNINWDLYKAQETNTQASNSTLQTSSLTTYSSQINKMLNEISGLATNPKEIQAQKPNPFEGEKAYTLGRVISGKAQVPAANNLYSSLVKLADYLRKETEANWKGVFDALKTIGQALGDFGIPDVGRKRG